MEQCVKLLRLNTKNCFLLIDKTLVNKVNGYLESGGSGTLTVSCLEHIELAVFNGKLHILHILIVSFKLLCDSYELFIDFGHIFLKLCNLAGSTDTCNNVLALSVDEILAEESVLTGSGVTGECNACAGVGVKVAEYHGLNINGSTP